MGTCVPSRKVADMFRSETYSLCFVLRTVVVVVFFFLSVDAAESSKVESLEKTLLETSEVGRTN